MLGTNKVVVVVVVVVLICNCVAVTKNFALLFSQPNRQVILVNYYILAVLELSPEFQNTPSYN